MTFNPKKFTACCVDWKLFSISFTCDALCSILLSAQRQLRHFHSAINEIFIAKFSLLSIITDRVRSTREGNVFSLFTPGGGVPRPGPDGGVPQPGLIGGNPARSDGGYPCWGGTPPQVPPPQLDLARGVPRWGYSTSGTPQFDLARGYQCRGYPILGTPHQTWLDPHKDNRWST